MSDSVGSTTEAAGRRAGWVAEADPNGDGVSLEEVRAFLRSRSADVSEASAEPEVLVHEFPAGNPVTEAGCRAAGEYSASRNGYSFLVMVDGRLVFERYDQGRSADDPHRLASGTKSFSAALVALGVKDELLTLDEPVSATITEWKDDPQREAITLRQLLSLTSGIDPGDNSDVPSYAEAVKAKSVGPPGEKFRYGPIAFQVFGEVIRRKLEARDDLPFAEPLAYLESRIFQPLGLRYATWRRDENGMPHLPSGAFLTAREWAKFGEFLRLGGRWDGEDLVDRVALTECLKGSDVNETYGLALWLLDRPDPVWMEGAFMAAGAGKQRIIVLPVPRVLVVRQGESTRYEDRELLQNLFGKQ